MIPLSLTLPPALAEAIEREAALCGQTAAAWIVERLALRFAISAVDRRS